MTKYKIPIKYGLYGAVLGFVFYLMLLFSGNSPWSSASWMGCWIPGVTALFSIKQYTKDNSLDASFSTLFVVSLIVIFLQAFCFNLIAFLFALLFETNAIEMYKTEVFQYAEQIATILGEEFYGKMAEEMENITLFSLTFGDFTNKIIGGIIVSLILAGFLKKNKPSLESNE